MAMLKLETVIVFNYTGLERPAQSPPPWDGTWQEPSEPAERYVFLHTHTLHYMLVSHRLPPFIVGSSALAAARTSLAAET